jgi:hypothetical protein
MYNRISLLIFIVYYNPLPTNVQQISDYLNQREEFLKFNRDFELIR